MGKININQNLLYSASGALDPRFIVDSIDKIENISNAYVGLEVYVVNSENNIVGKYKIKKINNLTKKPLPANEGGYELILDPKDLLYPDGTPFLNNSGYVNSDTKLIELSNKIDKLPTGIYYGQYSSEENLPDVSELDQKGYAYVASSDPTVYYIYLYNGGDATWEDSGNKFVTTSLESNLSTKSQTKAPTTKAVDDALEAKQDILTESPNVIPTSENAIIEQYNISANIKNRVAVTETTTVEGVDITEVKSLGYKVLKPYNVNDASSTIAAQIESTENVDNSNMVFEIKDNFDLNEGTLTIPPNCTLKFNGGKITNGNIDFNYCNIIGNCVLENIIPSSVKLAQDVLFEWFGAKGDGVTDDTNAIKNALLFCKKLFSPTGNTNPYRNKTRITLLGKYKACYLITETITIESNISVVGGFTFVWGNVPTNETVAVEIIGSVNEQEYSFNIENYSPNYSVTSVGLLFRRNNSSDTTGLEHCNFHNMNIYYFQTGIKITNNHIYQCKFTDIFVHGLYGIYVDMPSGSCWHNSNYFNNIQLLKNNISKNKIYAHSTTPSGTEYNTFKITGSPGGVNYWHIENCNFEHLYAYAKSNTDFVPINVSYNVTSESVLNGWSIKNCRFEIKNDKTKIYVKGKTSVNPNASVILRIPCMMRDSIIETATGWMGNCVCLIEYNGMRLPVGSLAAELITGSKSNGIIDSSLELVPYTFREKCTDIQGKITIKDPLVFITRYDSGNTNLYSLTSVSNPSSTLGDLSFAFRLNKRESNTLLPNYLSISVPNSSYFTIFIYKGDGTSAIKRSNIPTEELKRTISSFSVNDDYTKYILASNVTSNWGVNPFVIFSNESTEKDYIIVILVRSTNTRECIKVSASKNLLIPVLNTNNLVHYSSDFGPTSERPFFSSVNSIGYQYFDTDLKMPLWFDGYIYRDGIGSYDASKDSGNFFDRCATTLFNTRVFEETSSVQIIPESNDEPGYIHGETGAIITSSSAGYRIKTYDISGCTELKFIAFTRAQDSYKSGYAFFDEQDTYIEGSASYYTVVKPAQLYTYTINSIPSGAKYLKISTRNSAEGICYTENTLVNPNVFYYSIRSSGTANRCWCPLNSTVPVVDAIINDDSEKSKYSLSHTNGMQIYCIKSDKILRHYYNVSSTSTTNTWYDMTLINDVSIPTINKTDNVINSLACSTAGASIYYTIYDDEANAISPTKNSDLYYDGFYTLVPEGSGAPTWAANTYYSKEGDTFVVSDSKPSTWSDTYTSYYTKSNTLTLNAEDTIWVKSIKIGYNSSDIKYTNKVATPSISINDEGIMTITCDTTEASILYSLDGTTPTIPYDEPVLLNDTCVVKALAQKTGMGDSDVVEKQYTIEPESAE